MVVVVLCIIVDQHLLQAKLLKKWSKFIINKGNKGLAIKYGGWDEKSYEEFEKEWLK